MPMPHHQIAPFSLSRLLLALALLACPTHAEEPAHAPKTTLNIGSQLQLLLDPRLIASSSAIEHRLHTPVQQPRPKSPLIGHYATVIKDGPLYRAYYRGSDPTYKGKSYSGHPGEITCYAESRDGHEWTFPKLGLFEVNGTRENNVILAHQPPYSTNFSPFLDTNPNVDPKERFKALAGHPGYDRQAKATGRATGLAAFISADGIHWQRRDKDDVIPYDPAWSHAFDSQNVSFWSEAESQYVCYFRTWCPNPAVKPEAPSQTHAEAGAKGTLRSISRTTSPDFRTWSPPIAMNPNLPGEHLYTSQTAPYFRAPHLYIATPTRYVAGHLGTEKTHSMLGSTDILLMTTHAGTNTYDRPFTDAFIRPGIDPDRWQSRANYLALNIVPTAPNEISLYHARSGHRLTLRTDGFASARATSKKGQFITPPMTFTGTTLHLNLSTSAAGSITVEIQDPNGTPIDGFALANCPPIVGDRIDHPVTWKSKPSLQHLAGKPIRLRFVMQEADLFAFQFRKK